MGEGRAPAAEGSGGCLAASALGAVLAVGVAFRLHALGRLPGINGDEAWYGVQVLRLLAGEVVDWRTPSGTLLGPLHAGLLLLLQPISPRSLDVLRWPSVLASLGQLVLLWVVVRRHFGRAAAAWAVAIGATLPIQIAYARFGWDPSHSGLVAVAAAHAALSGRPLATAALYALAIAVHPTNVFLAPFLWVASLLAAVPRIGWRSAAKGSAVQGALLAAGLLVLAAVASGGAARPLVAGAIDRLLDPGEWSRSILLFARLLSGDTVFEYVVGEGLGPWRGPADLGVLLVLGGLLGAGGWRLARRAPGPEAGVVAGWLAMVATFVVLAGSHGLRPHLERYAVVLVGPTILAVAVLLREVGALPRARWAPAVVVGLCAVLALGATWTRYFVPLEARGSSSHPTFWSGAVEPKEEAWRRIEAAAAPRGGARLIAEDWWTYWALAFLAHGSPIAVQMGGGVPGRSPPGGTYFVGFPGGPLERWAGGQPALLPRWEIPGAGGRVVLRVWWTPAGAEPVSPIRRGGAPH